MASLPLAAALPRNLQAATLVRNPYVQNLRPDRATILFSTAERGAGLVQYSADGVWWGSVAARMRELAPSETRMRASQFHFQAELTGLNPGVEYFYRVLVDGQDLTVGEELRFRTAGNGPFNFVVFGDSGQSTPEQARLAQLMTRERPSVVLHVGDIAYYNGTYEQFQNEYFRPYNHLMRRFPFFPTPGNHDYETQSAGPYLALHALPDGEVPAADRGRYYSFDWGNVHFISLDSNLPLTRAASGTGPMLEWLENDLRRTRQFWKIAYFHHPPYASGPNEKDPLSILARQHLAPILERHGVQLVLNGHEHSYQQTRSLRNGEVVEPGTGTVYVTSGGGGASLYSVSPRPTIAFAESAHHYVRAEVRGAQITLHVYRVDGQEIDTVNLSPLPALAAEGVVNAASFTPSFAPGSLISLFGRNLAPEDLSASALPLPKDLGGVTVRINTQRLPLLFVSPYQVNAQLTYDTVGEHQVQITTANGVFEQTVRIAETAPALFPTASLVHASGALITAEAPAEPDETIIIYLTGLGRVTGDAQAGVASPSSPLAAVRAPVEVQIAGQSVRPAFAGLAPGFVGLYQLNVRVPVGLARANHAVRVVAGNATSNEVTLAVG